MDPSALFTAPAAIPLDLVEAVVARRLFDERVWESPRIADGVSALRVVERSDTRVRLCGRIWTVAQSLHAFWLDLERDSAQSDAIRWVLYFDIDAGDAKARRLRDAVESFDDPIALAWVWELRGS